MSENFASIPRHLMRAEFGAPTGFPRRADARAGGGYSQPAEWWCAWPCRGVTPARRARAAQRPQRGVAASPTPAPRASQPHWPHASCNTLGGQTAVPLGPRAQRGTHLLRVVVQAGQQRLAAAGVVGGRRHALGRGGRRHGGWRWRGRALRRVRRRRPRRHGAGALQRLGAQARALLGGAPRV